MERAVLHEHGHDGAAALVQTRLDDGALRGAVRVGLELLHLCKKDEVFQKAVDALKLKDKSVAQNVLNIIANRYFELNDIYDVRDKKLKAIKADTTMTAVQKAEGRRFAEFEASNALYRTHFAFPAALSIYLNDAQIETVKDVITFNVVNVTYKATLDMIPSLKDEEKTQILVWLKEARELAIDAESSKKKHEVFGKYKGRINNYLTARGYDLKKEREEWYKRIEARKAKEAKSKKK
jgi:hypothetical protein